MKNFKFCFKENKKGYFYTVITATLILISLSILFFYFQQAETNIYKVNRRIAIDKLHYFVENLKKDYDRILKISGSRAITIAIGYILNSSKNFTNYEMSPCSDFVYDINGSEAAISELMLCGTLFGEKVTEMENNTILNWTKKVKEMSKEDINIKILRVRNITIMLYDSWNIAILSVLEISVSDRGNFTFFNGNLTITSLIPIEDFEDPLYYLKTKDLDLTRKFKVCNLSEEVNGSVINKWINERCYHSSNESYNAPSFFDRLDGNLNLSEKYVNQTNRYFKNSIIGLESFINLSDFWYHNLSINFGNYTWIDYLYWQRVKGDCKVNDTVNYAINETQNITFKIDYSHKIKYDILGAECDTT